MKACVADEFESRVFGQVKQIFDSQAPENISKGIALAYSGGLDSSVLLVLLRDYAHRYQLPFFAFHIHHGLSAHADAWRAHCASTCAALGVAFASTEVQIQSAGDGIESAARRERYRALGRLCEEREISYLLTAHHQDDQAETVLMQMLRGTGLRGLGGMDEINHAPDLLGSAHLKLVRPLLMQTRSSLENFASERGIAHISDESNQDLQFTRNAVRHRLMPVLESISPNFAERFFRTALHARAANRILDQIAADDLKRCLQTSTAEALDIPMWQSLGEDRMDNLLRYWILSKNMQAPSTSKLQEMRKQVLRAREDACVSVSHLNFHLHRYANKVFLVKQAPVIAQSRSGALNQENDDTKEPITLHWQGEPSIDLPQWQGRLHFISGDQGIARASLSLSRLQVRAREGGERLRLAKNRPSRDLKSHFQTLRIPFWERAGLPLVYADQDLIFVARLGLNADFLDETDGEKIQIQWQSYEEINKH